MERIPCNIPFESPKNWRDRWINGQGVCVQGNATACTHTGDLAYAFDFKLRPGTKVLAGRSGVVAAVCDHFREGGHDESLLPRANFVALRHPDGTYTRYVHLMYGGVLVRVNQVVKAGQPIALSGNTGFTTGPHLHFDVVNVLPQETSELRVMHPVELVVPSVAAIFSGPFSLGGRNTAPLVYLSKATLRAYSYAKKATTPTARAGTPVPAYDCRGRRVLPPVAAALYASLPPLLAHHPEAIVLVDRGGANGDQTFAEVVELAASAVADFPVPGNSPRVGVGCQEGGQPLPRLCRCIGVIVANDRRGHEVFSMAPPKDQKRWGGCQRAPFPVVMVSQESGQALKGAAAASVAYAGNGDGAAGGETLWESCYRGWAGMASPTTGAGTLLNHVAGAVVISLGASEHCRALEGPVGRPPGDDSLNCVDDDDEEDYDGGRFTSVGCPPGASPMSDAAGVLSRNGSRRTGGGGWTRGRMLYRTRTLPVKFVP